MVDAPGVCPAPRTPLPPVLVGTAGWADRDLVAADWYPPHVRTAAARLAYYAERFPLVGSRHVVLRHPRGADRARLGRSRAASCMDIKAYRLLTGHRHPTASLPAQLRDDALGRGSPPADVPSTLLHSAWQLFHDALEPLRVAGNLGLVLLQFPASVTRRLTRPRAGLGGPRAVPPPSSRRRMAPRLLARTASARRSLRLLREYDAAYVCVDMPQHSPAAMPADLEVTADTAVIRLHGRSEQWIAGDKRDRYRYDYSAQEILHWASSARELAGRSEQVHVIFNNCCAGAAQRAASDLRTGSRCRRPCMKREDPGTRCGSGDELHRQRRGGPPWPRRCTRS